MVSVHEHDGTVRLKAVFYEHVRRPVACDPLDEVGPHDLAAVRVVPSVVVVHTQVGTLDEAVIIGGARLEQCEQLRAAVHLCKSKTRMAPSKLHELYRWHHRRVSSKSQAASLLGCLERHLGAASLGQSAPWAVPAGHIGRVVFDLAVHWAAVDGGYDREVEPLEPAVALVNGAEFACLGVRLGLRLGLG